jgi:YD repeat-containing protein
MIIVKPRFLFKIFLLLILFIPFEVLSSDLPDFKIFLGDSLIKDDKIDFTNRGFYQYQEYINFEVPNINSNTLINTVNGNLFHKRQDYFRPDFTLPVDITFTYNSGSSFSGYYGNGWQLCLNLRYVSNNYNKNIIIVNPDDRTDLFLSDSNSFISPFPDRKLEKSGEGCKLTVYFDSLMNYGDYTEYYFLNKDNHYVSYIQDKNKRRLIFYYNQFNQLTSVQYYNKVKVKFYYEKNKLIKIEQPDSLFINYIYDNKNNLKTVLYPDGSKIEYIYDDNCNLMKGIVNRNGDTTSIHYDENFFVSKVVLPNPLYYIDLTYNLNLKRCEVNSYSGLNMVFEHDSLSRTTDIFRFDKKIEKTYDKVNNLTSFKDYRNAVTYFHYDTLGYLNQVIDPLNNKTSYNREPKYKKINSVTEKDGHTFELTYDALGNITEKKYINSNDAGFQILYPQTINYYSYIHFFSNTVMQEFILNQDSVFEKANDMMEYVYTFKFDKNYNLIKYYEQYHYTPSDFSLEYNLFNQLKSLTYYDNIKKSFEYDNLGNISKYIFEDNSFYKYNYDNSGRLISIIDPINNQFKINYLKNNKILFEENPTNSTLFSFDIFNRLNRVDDLFGKITTYQYDENNNIISFVKNNFEKKFIYNLNNTITGIEFPDSKNISLSYDLNDNISEVKLPNNAIYKYEFQNRNFIHNVIFPENNKYLYNEYGFNYNFDFDLPNNSKYQYFFTPLMSQSFYKDYNNYFTLLREKFYNGSIASFQSTGLNNPKNTFSINDYYKNYFQTEHDIRGNHIAKIINNDTIFKYKYDKLGRITEITDLNGNSKKYEYDFRNNITSFTNEIGNKIIIEAKNDSLIINQNNRKYLYYYDKFGNLASVINPKLTLFRLLYDNYNRPENFVAPDNITYSLFYDDIGNITETKDALNLGYKFAYNSLSYPLSFVNKSGNSISLKYDEVNNPIEYTDFDSKKYILDYDMDGVVKKITYPTGDSIVRSFEYNPPDNWLRFTKYKDFNGNEYSYFDTYTYTFPINNIVTGKDTIAVQRKYDSLSNRFNLICKYPGLRPITYNIQNNGILSDINFGDSITIKFDYNKTGKISKAYLNNFSFFEVAYNTNLDITSYKIWNSYSKQYIFDELGQIEEEKSSDFGTINFNYDNIGNLIFKNYYDQSKDEFVYDKFGKLLVFNGRIGKTFKYEYDYEGNLTKFNPNDIDSLKYFYNNLNQLTKFNDQLNNSVSYEYNGLNKLSKIIFADKSAISFTLNNTKDILSITNPNNDITLYNLDKLNRIQRITNGIERNFSYNLNGQSLVNFYENYKFDSLSRLIELKDFYGTKKFFYSGKSVSADIITFNKLKYKISYKSLELPVAININDNIFHQFSYDSGNNLSEYINPLESLYKYEYNQESEIKTFTYPTGLKFGIYLNISNDIEKVNFKSIDKFSFSYTPTGNVKNFKDNIFDIYNYYYDPLSRMILLKDNSGSETEFIYDKLNRLTNCTFDNGAIYLYFYDKSGNTIKSQSSDGLDIIISKKYDSNNRLIEQQTNFNSQFSFIIGFNYDNKDRLITILENRSLVASINYLEDSTIFFQTGNLNITQKRNKILNIDTLIISNGIYEIIKYDNFNNIIDIIVQTKDARLGYIQNIYNKNNMLVQQLINDKNVREYKYNSDGDIIENMTNSDTTVYNYDINTGLRENVINNGLVLDCQYSNNEQVIKFGNNTYEYDLNGNRSSKTDSVGTTRYYYDSEKRLKQVIMSDGIYKFEYNSDGELAASFYQDTNYYIYDKSHAKAKLKAVLDNKGNIKQSFLAVSDFDKICSLVKNSTNDYQIIIKDGNLKSVFSIDKDFNIDFIDSTDVFGVPIGNLNIKNSYSDFLYFEKFGLYFDGERFYDPEICQYIQPSLNALSKNNSQYIYKPDLQKKFVYDKITENQIYVNQSDVIVTENPINNKFFNFNAEKLVFNTVKNDIYKQFNSFKSFNLILNDNSISKRPDFLDPDSVVDFFTPNISKFINFNFSNLGVYPKVDNQILDSAFIENLKDYQIFYPDLKIDNRNIIQKIIDVMSLAGNEKSVIVNQLKDMLKQLNFAPNPFPGNIIKIDYLNIDIKTINNQIKDYNITNKIMKVNYLNKQYQNPLKIIDSLLKSVFIDKSIKGKYLFDKDYQNQVPVLDFYNPNYFLPKEYFELNSINYKNIMNIIKILFNSKIENIVPGKELYEDFKIYLPVSYQFLNNLPKKGIKPKFRQVIVK